MLYLCSLLNLSSVIVVNAFLQNTMASSIVRPKTCKTINGCFNTSRKLYLQEQSVVKSAKMFEMTVFPEILVQCPHAQREVLPSQIVYHFGLDLAMLLVRCIV